MLANPRTLRVVVFFQVYQAAVDSSVTLTAIGGYLQKQAGLRRDVIIVFENAEDCQSVPHLRKVILGLLAHQSLDGCTPAQLFLSIQCCCLQPHAHSKKR